MPPEVPLIVATSESFQEFYFEVLQGAHRRGSNNAFYEVGMYAFAVVNSLSKETVFYTTGAGPCTIMLVHMRRGFGALGHFAAMGDLKKEVGGIVQMVEECREQSRSPKADPISIVFAAGTVDPEKILSSIRSLYPKSFCSYVGKKYGSCVYLPQRSQAAFSKNYLVTRSDNWFPRLMTKHSFDQRDAPLN